MTHPNTLGARTRRSLMALAVAAVLLVIAALSAHAQTPAVLTESASRNGHIQSCAAIRSLNFSHP